MARRRALVLFAILALVVGSAGRAAPKDADFELGLFVKQEVSPLAPYTVVPDGGTVTVPWRKFVLIVGVRLAPAQPEHAHLRVELGNGLSWGAENPSNTGYCTGNASTADCDTMPSRADARGPTEEAFVWDVTAAADGRYVVRAQLTEPSVADPVLSNNRITATLVVREEATIVVGNVLLAPAKPKAGSALTATVEILTTAPAPPRPTGLRCSGRVGTTRLAGTPTARPGKAKCLYRPPRSAKGKTLSGSVSFTAVGKRYAKPFRVRLG